MQFKKNFVAFVIAAVLSTAAAIPVLSFLFSTAIIGSHSYQVTPLDVSVPEEAVRGRTGFIEVFDSFSSFLTFTPSLSLLKGAMATVMTVDR